MWIPVFLGSLFACTVSSIPLDTGNRTPNPQLILSPTAAVPLHTHPAPLVPLSHINPHPIFHSVPEPIIHSVGNPLPLSPPQLPLVTESHPLPAPISAPSSQFHAQDEFGQFSFGYENINSAKTETKDAFGVTRGSYEYVDANGILQTVKYIADDINGFRVIGTNIPVAAAALPVSPAASLPVPVMETAEVAEARAAHLAAHEEAKVVVLPAPTETDERKKREAEDESPEPEPETDERKKREAADESSEPEPEPEPEADKKKREAEPMSGDYAIQSATLVSPSVFHADPLTVTAPNHLPLLSSHLNTLPASLYTHVLSSPQTVFLPPRYAFTSEILPSFTLGVQKHNYLNPEQFSLVPEQLRFVHEPHINNPIQFSSPILASSPVSIPAPIPAPISAPNPATISAPIPSPIPVTIPATVTAPIPASIPSPISTPISAPSSQFHAQDEFGQFSFGYENINSAKTETKDAFGVTRGSYQYIDANGILQTVNYIADDINGFRASGTNIPVAPSVIEDISLPVEDPEVAAARLEHLAAHTKAKAALDAANVESQTEEER